MNIQCDHVIEARRPDIILIDKMERSCIMIDIAIPGDEKIHQRQQEKVEKYQDLRREVKRLWDLRKVQVVPIVIGALGSVTNDLDVWLEKIGITIKTAFLQKTALLGTARILRKVLEY